MLGGGRGKGFWGGGGAPGKDIVGFGDSGQQTRDGRRVGSTVPTGSRI